MMDEQEAKITLENMDPVWFRKRTEALKDFVTRAWPEYGNRGWKGKQWVFEDFFALVPPGVEVLTKEQVKAANYPWLECNYPNVEMNIP